MTNQDDETAAVIGLRDAVAEVIAAMIADLQTAAGPCSIQLVEGMVEAAIAGLACITSPAHAADMLESMAGGYRFLADQQRMTAN